MVPRGTARSSLLASAVDLIAAHGVNAVGVDAIADRAGTTKRTLYQHFASKDALVAEALSANSTTWHERVSAAVAARAEDPEGQLLALFDLIGEDAARPAYRGCVFVNAAADLPDPAHPARPVASRHKQRLLDFLTERTSRLGVRDPQRLARQIKVLLEGVVATALVDPGPQPAQDARAAAEILIMTEKGAS
ncbi:TetR/AcrR family transcriptional regulator [Hamadaea tsunoensis]|uniref:TetR/AcrR family transcriptional regulator n=1 Tax=Hamadaea tsunoensis TaxID=53368 RepID=UPI000483EC46|nr:TetR family transcriptional regulator [Hamadaea tsunoensis]